MCRRHDSHCDQGRARWAGRLVSRSTGGFPAQAFPVKSGGRRRKAWLSGGEEKGDEGSFLLTIISFIKQRRKGWQ